jgi:hypothetical protein
VAEPSYSPRLRTALVLGGTGTAGAYQAGVLRALVEAGVKIDIIAAHGVGVATALCAAIDGGARLWGADGPWTDRRLRTAYAFRTPLRLAGYGLGVALLLLLTPLILLILAGATYVLGMVAALANLPDISARLVGWYAASLELLFSPPVLPTIVPRLVVLALVVVAGVLVWTGVRAWRQERTRRRFRGAFWWRLLGTPLSGDEPAATLIDALWRLVQGASSEPRPRHADISRRFVDTLADNFGQPGFREVLVAVHDVDARRDLVGALLAPPARSIFETRREGRGPREAGIVDFTGPERELVVDFLTGALRLPAAAPPHLIQFPIDSYWRGEAHRICDRPGLTTRLLDELDGLGVEQVVLVSPAEPPAVPHTMRRRSAGLREKMGEIVRTIETAAWEDAEVVARGRFPGAFVIRPGYNPIGPFDVDGIHDESSDRRRTIAELLEQGYDDAYRQFIEPVVATGDRIEV